MDKKKDQGFRTNFISEEQAKEQALQKAIEEKFKKIKPIQKGMWWRKIVWHLWGY